MTVGLLSTIFLLLLGTGVVMQKADAKEVKLTGVLAVPGLVPAKQKFSLALRVFTSNEEQRPAGEGEAHQGKHHPEQGKEDYPPQPPPKWENEWTVKLSRGATVANGQLHFSIKLDDTAGAGQAIASLLLHSADHNKQKKKKKRKRKPPQKEEEEKGVLELVYAVANRSDESREWKSECAYVCIPAMATDGDIYGVYHLHHHQQQQQQAAAAAVQVVATKKGHFWPQSNQQYVLGTEHQPIHLGKCLFN